MIKKEEINEHKKQELKDIIIRNFQFKLNIYALCFKGAKAP